MGHAKQMARIAGCRALQAGLLLVWLLLSMSMSDALEQRLGDGLLAKALSLVLFVLSGIVAAVAVKAIERAIVNSASEKRADLQRGLEPD